jgi:hypothetical protein
LCSIVISFGGPTSSKIVFSDILWHPTKKYGPKDILFNPTHFIDPLVCLDKFQLKWHILTEIDIRYKQHYIYVWIIFPTVSEFDFFFYFKGIWTNQSLSIMFSVLDHSVASAMKHNFNIRSLNVFHHANLWIYNKHVLERVQMVYIYISYMSVFVLT